MSREQPGRFDGRVAVVTGAAAGIGRACAATLAAGAAHIIAVDRDERVNDPMTVPERLWSAVHGDLTLPATVEQLWHVADKAGRCAILINSVFAEERATLSKGTEAGWMHTFRVSTLTAVLLSQAFVDRADGDSAAIVNIASVHAFGARNGFAAYASAKAALLAFTRAAALEWGPRHVRVNAVAPGFVAVERNAHVWKDPHVREQLARANPLGRLGAPADVASAVAFLASNEASFITGAVLPVDGGLLAKLPEEPSP